MRKSTAKPRRKKALKRALAVPDLEQSKAAVLSSLTSASGQRAYDHALREFVAWYCSEPRLAFNRTVVLRSRIRPPRSLPGHRRRVAAAGRCWWQRVHEAGWLRDVAQVLRQRTRHGRLEV